MASLIVYEFLSLDGFFEGPKGQEMDFVQSAFLPSMERDIADQYDAVEAFVMGRRTFDLLGGYWPTEMASQEHLVDYMNGRTKLVISSNPDVSNWMNSEHLGNTPFEALAARKKTACKDLMVIGSGEVVNGLLDLGLVDELRLLVFPVLLGKGRRLFNSSSRPLNLRQVRNDAFENGTLILHYETNFRTRN